MVAQSVLMLFGSFFIMLFAGVPISAGIGIASIFTALVSGMPADIFALIAAQRCFSGLDSFSLLALPFFSLGGNIMNKGGIAKRLVRLARLLELDLDQTNRLLKIGRKEALYPRIRYDAAVIFAIEKKLPLEQMDELLTMLSSPFRPEP